MYYNNTIFYILYNNNICNIIYYIYLLYYNILYSYDVTRLCSSSRPYMLYRERVSPLMFRQNTDNRRISGLLQKYGTSSKICYTHMTHEHCYVLQVRHFVTLVCTRLRQLKDF